MENADFEFYSYLDAETLELFRKMVAVQEPGTDVEIKFHFGTGRDYDEYGTDDDYWEIRIEDMNGDGISSVGDTLKIACISYFVEREKL